MSTVKIFINFILFLVISYLTAVEKIWPFAKYYWSQEFALEFLYTNNNDIKKTLDLIKNLDESYTKFMKRKHILEYKISYIYFNELIILKILSNYIFR